MYNRFRPFHAQISNRYRLNKKGSTKETWHVELSISGSNITYRPGDSIAIIPINDAKRVQRLCEEQNWDAHREVFDQKTETHWRFDDYLISRVNIDNVSSKFLKIILENEIDSEKKLFFEALLEDHDRIKVFSEKHSVDEILLENPKVRIDQDEFLKALPPLLPRFYSIASSQNSVGNSIHLTVSRVRYEVEGKMRLGVCSHFLCDLVSVNTFAVPCYMHPTKDFLLPDDPNVPIIMIGPGTGVAPFRAFMQERLFKDPMTKNNWLFFGERNEECDFFYEDYWKKLEAEGSLFLDYAFSRDQEHKVYVQDRLWEKRKQFWQWMEDGAILYVCGDAKKMAKDVETTFLRIIQEEKGVLPEDARKYLNALRKEKRYLRDVY